MANDCSRLFNGDSLHDTVLHYVLEEIQNGLNDGKESIALAGKRAADKAIREAREQGATSVDAFFCIVEYFDAVTLEVVGAMIEDGLMDGCMICCGVERVFISSPVIALHCNACGNDLLPDEEAEPAIRAELAVRGLI